jgi:hypothetical protein
MYSVFSQEKQTLAAVDLFLTLHCTRLERLRVNPAIFDRLPTQTLN